MLIYRQAGSTGSGGSGGSGTPTMAGVFYQEIVTGGSSAVIPMTGAAIPCTVTAAPLSGDTLTISYSTDDGINYQVWAAGVAGVVASLTAVIFDFPITHIQAVCTGTGSTSSVTVC